MSSADQSPMPPSPGVMFGTLPRPSGEGAPASQRPASIAPAKLRGVWHSPQCPGPSTRYRPRASTGSAASTATTGASLR